jgi:ornithine cyclodeaminase
MRVVSAAEIDRRLDFPALIAALARAFASGYKAPQRHHHEIARADAAHATQLLMPAWTEDAPGEGAFLGVKIVNVFPDNGARGLPAVNGVYVLQNGATGEPLAVMDGARLTVWRTAAASALAASRLARADASRLCMVGAGALAPFLIRAHAAVRPIRRVTLWNRRRAASEALAADLAGFEVRIEDDIQRAVSEADVISCATLSRTPLVEGRWLTGGQHLDLVGAFNLQMREADDEALRRARVYIDTPAALTEGGDVALALAAGAIDRAHVRGDLAALCRDGAGRGAADAITAFKSVGAAIEDLAAAMLVWSRLTA